MTEFLITFRESIEAIMIVCIIRGCLTRRGHTHFRPYIVLASICGILGSIGFGIILYMISIYSQAVALDTLFEGVVMMITSIMLLQMLHWIHKGSYTVMGSNLMQSSPANCATCPLVPEQAGPHTRSTIKSILTSLTTNTHAQSGLKGIFFLIFFAILREGVETVLMLFGASSVTGSFSYSGFRGGLAAGSITGYALYGLGTRLPMKAFFTITSWMLLLFSAGMMTYGVHEIEEYVVDAGYITEPTRVWEVFQTPLSDTDTYHPLHDKGSIGIWLKAFVGRNSNPNYVEPFIWLLVMSYGITLLYTPIVTGTKHQSN